MEKFRECELNEILRDFKNKEKLELELQKGLTGKLVLKNVNINYNRENGYINIESEEGKLQINTTLVCSYEKNKNEIYIDLDTIAIKIKINITG